MTQPDWPFIRIAAGLIVDGAGRVLLVRKRGTQTFMQAGGKIEPDETPYYALARELEEELGLRLEPHTPEYLGQFVAQAANETNRTVKAEVFYIRADAALCPASEIEEIVWIAPGDDSLQLAPLTRDHLLPIARQSWRKPDNSARRRVERGEIRGNSSDCDYHSRVRFVLGRRRETLRRRNRLNWADIGQVRHRRCGACARAS